MDVDMTSTMNTIRSILVEFGISASAVTPDARLRRDLELDSTEAVDLSLELHKRLGVRVKIPSSPDMQLMDICKLVAAQSAAA